MCHDVILDIVKQKKAKLEYDDGRDSGWSSCQSESLNCDRRVKRLVFSASQNRQKFALIFRILDDTYQNLIKNSDKTGDDFYCTKRALFYKFKNEVIKRFVKRQQKVEWAINQVTLLLDCGPWELGKFNINNFTLHESKNIIWNLMESIHTCHSCQDYDLILMHAVYN